MLSEKKIKLLKHVFSKFKDINAAYLFGSHAEDRENKYSDLDIGLVLNDGYNPMLKLDILIKLTENNFENIDIVILNPANPLIKYEVIKNNKLIYKQDSFDASSYYSLVTRTFLDFRPYLDVQRRYLKKRILNGSYNWF